MAATTLVARWAVVRVGSSTNLRRPPPRTLAELKLRAEALAGRSVRELADGLRVALPANARRAKGYIGTLVEWALGADPRAGDGPDFPLLGVELKTIPLRRTGTPAESTFCCSITMGRVDRETWEASRLRRRLSCVLWVPVEAAAVAPLGDRRFGHPWVWQPSRSQWDRLRADWETLVGAVATGRCPSAHEGQVLQLRPKAAHGRVRALAAVDGAARALPLGLYLRASFTVTLLAPHA